MLSGELAPVNFVDSFDLSWAMVESIKMKKDLPSMSNTRLPSHFLTRETTQMEKCASSTSKKRKLSKMTKNIIFGEAMGEFIKMEKDLLPTSNTRFPSHFLMRETTMIEKCASSTCKKRKLSNMTKKAMGEFIKMKKDLPSTSNTRLPSHFLMRETTMMEKCASLTSKKRKLSKMTEKAMGESIKMKKDLPLTSNTRLPSHFLMREITMMEKCASSTSKKRKLSKMMEKAMGNSIKMKRDLPSTSNTRLPSHFLTREITMMEKCASSMSKKRKLLKMTKKTIGESIKMKKGLPSTSNTRLPSHFLMKETTKMEKDASSTSKKRKLSKMMKKAIGEFIKMEKDLPSTSNTSLPSHFLMRETTMIEKCASSMCKKRKLSKMTKKAMGKSIKMKIDLPSTSNTRLPSHFLLRETTKMGKCASSMSKKGKLSKMMKKATGKSMKMGRCKSIDIASRKKQIPFRTESVAPEHLQSELQEGEPSRQRRFWVYEICEICCDRKEAFDDMFGNKDCRHSICTDCISKHIQVKVESNSNLILCPGLDCRVVLAPESCKELLPKIVVERWEKMIIETMFLDTEKFYCPFKDCSAMLLNDSAENMRMMGESECPHCRRLFCVQCRVSWHSGMECWEFQSLNEDERGREDIQLKKLAEEKNWMRCPKCKFYVEKTEGCVHMRCRCSFEFCYRCGGIWSINHGPCNV